MAHQCTGIMIDTAAKLCIYRHHNMGIIRWATSCLQPHPVISDLPVIMPLKKQSCWHAASSGLFSHSVSYLLITRQTGAGCTPRHICDETSIRAGQVLRRPSHTPSSRYESRCVLCILPAVSPLKLWFKRPFRYQKTEDSRYLISKLHFS